MKPKMNTHSMVVVPIIREGGRFNSKRGYNNGGKQWRVNNQQKFSSTDKHGRK